MKTYIEQENGNLTINGLRIPADNDNAEYHDAISALGEGLATIELWSGSQRESDRQASQSRSEWKASRSMAVSMSTVSVDGMVFDGDEVSQGRMARAIVSASSDAEQTIWVLANDTAVMVSALQLRKALKLAGQAQTSIWVQP